MGLQLRNKAPKPKVKAKLHEDRQPASGPNDIWAMDFLHGQLLDGRKIRILAVIDSFSRFSPAPDPWFAYKAGDVVHARTGRKGRRLSAGYSGRQRTGICVPWAYQRGVDFSRPGKPTHNPFAESFNGKVWA